MRCSIASQAVLQLLLGESFQVVIGLSKDCEWRADPYGNDITYLNVRHFIIDTLERGLEILKVKEVLVATMMLSRAQ